MRNNKDPEMEACATPQNNLTLPKQLKTHKN